MINNIFIFSGLIMCTWYALVRWTFCAKETWLFNPINFTTAILSILLLIPSIFQKEVIFNRYGYCLCVFLFIRNVYYTFEDIIDYNKSSNTPKQMFYITLDLFMLFYLFLWILKYYKVY